MTKRTFSTPFRRLYLFRFVFRCVVFAASVLLYVRSPQPLTALQGFGFFHSFTLLHLLWLLWMADMVSQLCRCRWYWPEGSQKFLDRSVLPPQSADDRAALRHYVRANNRRAAVMGAAWLAVTLAVGALYLGGCIDAGMILLICEFFYVCDVFCVVFWCPLPGVVSEKPLLHHLPGVQLGPSDDVCPAGVHSRLFHLDPVLPGAGGVPDLGDHLCPAP